MAITPSDVMKDALQNGASHFCPVCRSHDLALGRLYEASPQCVEQDVGCSECQATWTISFAFSEILKLESDDRKMGPEQLRKKYDGMQGTNWGRHPDYPMAVWQDEVANLDTRLGYWEWVQHRLLERETDG